jgi:UTP--glucose-1-phosphate uridylyltransferase
MDYLKEVEDISDLADIYYVRQKKQKGLGDAILCAKKHIDGEPFSVLLGDTITYHQEPCTKSLIDIYQKYQSSAIAIEAVPQEKIERYGIIKGTEVESGVYNIEDMVEKPPLEEAPSNLAITGRYILTPEIFDHLETIPPGVGGEIQLTDAMRLLDDIYGYVFPGRIYDIGTTVEWLKSSLEMALADAEVGAEMEEYLKNILENRSK